MEALDTADDDEEDDASDFSSSGSEDGSEDDDITLRIHQGDVCGVRNVGYHIAMMMNYNLCDAFLPLCCKKSDTH